MERKILIFLEWYIFLYPFLMSFTWTILGTYFWWRREKSKNNIKSECSGGWPPVTILVPFYNESGSIVPTCLSLELLNYPDYRVIFINDASTDESSKIVRQFLDYNKNFHLLNMTENVGKANALNYALEKTVSTPLTVVIDADTILLPDTLKYLVEPFCKQPRLGAVTANPIPYNKNNILEKLQTMEFASIVGLIKRAQRVVGRIFTVSGCATAYNTEALKKIERFSADTATEDIDITWKIQTNFYEVWFAPRGIAYIQIPSAFRDYWRQRKRWALGGWHMLRRYKYIFKDIRYRYLYPAFVEFVLSYIWAFLFVFGTFIWLITCLFFPLPFGFSPIPEWYGALLSIASTIQIVTAIIMNKKYDPVIFRTLFWVPWYPLFFFVFGAITIVWTFPEGAFGKLKGKGKWRSPSRIKN